MLPNCIHILLLLGLSDLTLAVFRLRRPGVQPIALNEIQNHIIQQQCGKVKSVDEKSSGSNFYIYKGKNMTQKEMRREAPWVVSINYLTVNPYETRTILCSGTLISPRHVLTAGHCQSFNKSSTTCDNDNLRHNSHFDRREVARYRVRVGTICGHRDCADQGKTHHVKRIIYPASFTDGNHPSKDYCPPYNGDTEDIAIYELTEDVEDAQFTCLAHEARKDNTMSNYGYGQSLEDQERHYLKKHTINYHSCEEWKRTGYPPANGVECIHFIEPNSSLACGGDSGGPVVSNYNGRTYSVGILAGGQTCQSAKTEADGSHGHFNTPGDFITSVPHYLNWICKWSGVCPPQADATKDRRPTNIWHRSDTHRDTR